MNNLSAEKFNEKTMTGKVNDKKVDKKVLLGSVQKDNMTIHIYQTNSNEEHNRKSFDFSVSIEVDDEKEESRCKCKSFVKPQQQVHFAKKRRTVWDKQIGQVICDSGFSSDETDDDDETDVIVSTPLRTKEDQELLDLFESITESDFEVFDDENNTVTGNKRPYVYKTVAPPVSYAKEDTYERKPYKLHYEKHRATLIQHGDERYEDTLKHEPWLVARVEPKIYLGYFAGYCGKNGDDAWLSFVPPTHSRYELSPLALVKEFKKKLSPTTLNMMKQNDLVMGQALFDVGMNLEEPYHCKKTDTVKRDANKNVLRYFGNSVKGFMKRYGVRPQHYKHHIERHHAMEDLN